MLGAFASQSLIDESEGGEDGKRKDKSSKKSKSKSSSKSAVNPAAQPGAGSGASGASVGATSAAGAAGEEYFAKFLTSSHLMSLELRDPHFRRHILVQVR